MKILDERRVIVCAGAGGAGKTTIAAALGVIAARSGQRAIVVTIDPARRLKDSLGLAELGDVPAEIALGASGRLFAMMLAQKPAWDRMIRERAPSPELRDRLLGNRFYRRFANDFAGAHAYAAVDTLCALADDAAYDVVIVDTPPMHHAVELFRAPSKVLELLSGGALPSVRAAQWIARRLEAAIGVAALREMADFLAALAEMAGVFIARANAMQALFAGARAACVVIATPDRRALDEAQMFLCETKPLGVRCDLLVLNRSALAALGAPVRDDRAVREELRPHLDAAALDFVLATRDRYRARARNEQQRVEALPLPCLLLPELESDVHDLAGLATLGAEMELRDPGR